MEPFLELGAREVDLFRAEEEVTTS